MHLANEINSYTTIHPPHPLPQPQLFTLSKAKICPTSSPINRVFTHPPKSPSMPPTTCESEPHHCSPISPQYQLPQQPQPKPTHPILNPNQNPPPRSQPQPKPTTSKPTKSWPQLPTTNPWSLTESRWVLERRQRDEKGREMMPGLWGRTREREGESEKVSRAWGERELEINKILYNLATMCS